MEAAERVEKDNQEGLMIDLRKVSGIQFDPETKEITSGVIDELDYIGKLVKHLWDCSDREEESGSEDFGLCLIFGWVYHRLNALRNHIETVLDEKSQVRAGHGED